MTEEQLDELIDELLLLCKRYIDNGRYLQPRDNIKGAIIDVCREIAGE